MNAPRLSETFDRVCQAQGELLRGPFMRYVNVGISVKQSAHMQEEVPPCCILAGIGDFWARMWGRSTLQHLSRRYQGRVEVWAML